MCVCVFVLEGNLSPGVNVFVFVSIVARVVVGIRGDDSRGVYNCRI